MMKAAIALMAALAATPAAASSVESAFERLVALAEQYSGQAIEDRNCTPLLCNAYVDNEQLNITWPDGGWLNATYFPYTGDTETQLMLCGTVIDFATGLGPEGSGMLAGQLLAEAQGGEARADIAGAQIRATLTSSGKLECDARRPRPLD